MSTSRWIVCLILLPFSVAFGTQFGQIPFTQVIGTPSITNDANITLTLGGTPTDAVLKPFSLTLGWTGTLAVTRGGTGSGVPATALANLGGQPLDSDLTAIAALTTNPFGRGTLELVDASAFRTYIGAGTSSFDGTFTSLTGKPTTIAGYGITDSPIGANPTAQVGISIVNGSAPTFMRSDAAPPINRTIDLSLSAAQSVTVLDSATSGLSTLLTLKHNSTGTPTTGFGAAMQVQSATDSLTNRFIGDLRWTWTNAVDANRTSKLVIRTVNNAGAGTDALTLFGAGGVSVNNSATDPGAGNFNLPSGSVYKINNFALNFSHLAGTADFATQVSNKPTTLSGYGITDGVSTAGSYANPAWITSFPWSKITGAPAFEPALGNPSTDGYVLSSTVAGVRSWIAPGGGGAVTSVFTRTGAVTAQSGDYTFAQIGSKPTTLSGYGITDGQPLDSDLTSISSLSTASFGRGALEMATAGAYRTYIGAENPLTFTNSINRTGDTIKLVGDTASPTASQYYGTNAASTLGFYNLPAGGGTVTNFTAGNMTPLFNTSVATSTTTPALTFSMSSTSTDSWFGRTAPGSGSPAYNSSQGLTKTDDTNVTLTLGGTPATALLRSVSLTLGWAGTLGVDRGGTGVANAPANTFFGNPTNSSAPPSFVVIGAQNVLVSTIDQTGTAEQTHLTYTVPANSVSVGTTFKFTAWGNVDNNTTPITYTPFLRWGGVSGTQLTNGPAFVSSTTANTNRQLTYEGLATIRSIGASGSIVVATKIWERTISATGTLSTIQNNSGASGTTINTTTSNDLVWDWTMNVNTGTPHIRTIGGYIEVIHP